MEEQGRERVVAGLVLGRMIYIKSEGKNRWGGEPRTYPAPDELDDDEGYEARFREDIIGRVLDTRNREVRPPESSVSYKQPNSNL